MALTDKQKARLAALGVNAAHFDTPDLSVMDADQVIETLDRVTKVVHEDERGRELVHRQALQQGMSHCTYCNAELGRPGP